MTGRSGTGKSLTVAAVLAAGRARWRTAAPGFEAAVASRLEERERADVAAASAAALVAAAKKEAEAEAKKKENGRGKG